MNWNYLRVRGEYVSIEEVRFGMMELPPRARRIQDFDLKRIAEIGTTSACAENTQPTKPTKPQRWNYLRVRGEYRSITKTHHWFWELPPRARRIHNEQGE